ncbi:10941_t:CDS:1, partial [Gigaspora rosea]
LLTLPRGVETKDLCAAITAQCLFQPTINTANPLIDVHCTSAVVPW